MSLSYRLGKTEQEQRNALLLASLQLNANSGSSTPQASTPTSTSISKLNGFPDEENLADLSLQADSLQHVVQADVVPVSGTIAHCTLGGQFALVQLGFEKCLKL